jgi:hypothetical protein
MESHFQNLSELPRDLVNSLTREVLRPSGLSIPVLNYTPEGLVASVRAGSRATIVKITKKDTASWADSLSTLPPNRAYGFKDLFLEDTAETITAVFGNDFWQSYRTAITKKAGENTPETMVKMIYALVAGDALYWRMSSQIYMDAMESETNEAKMLVLAKKAQIAFSHTEMSQNLLMSVCPCEVTVTVI